MAPTNVISRPLDHQERIVMRDFAAPTAKCARRETTAATMTAGYTVKKKNGTIGISAPKAVERAPEMAEVQGLRSPSSVVLIRSRASARISCVLSRATWLTKRLASASD